MRGVRRWLACAIAALWLALPGELAAQQPAPVVNFTGVLRERGTRAPLAGIPVVLDRPGPPAEEREAWSDADGRFAFEDLAPAEWRVRIEAPGYQSLSTTELVAPGELTSVTYYVERASDNPYDVTILAARPSKEVSRTSLPVAQLQKAPGAIGDPLAAIQNLAGIARSSFASGQIIVRGSAPEDTRVFVEGVEIPLIYHFGGLRSVIPVPLLESLEFHPGNFAPAYGRATGGIVDVRLERLAPERFGGSIDVSALDASLYLETPLGPDAAIAVGARRSYIGDVLGAVLPDDTLSLTVAPRYYDYQLLGRYRPAREHELGLFLLGSDDALELAFASPADIDPAFDDDRLASSERFYRALFSHSFVPSESFESRLRLSYGYSTEDDQLGQLRVDIQTHTLALRESVRHSLASELTLLYGLDLELERADVYVRAPGLPKEGEPQDFDLSELFTARDTVTRLSPAAYVSLELAVLPGWDVFPGVRVDHFAGTEQTVAQPRLTTRVAVSPSLALEGGVGLFAQEPSDDEINPDVGNPQLDAELALHYSAGAEYRPTDELSFEATLFYKDLSRLVSSTEAVSLSAGSAAPLRYDNGGQGRVYGGELLLRRDASLGLSGWLAYTLSRSVRTDSGSDEERLFDFDQTHVLTLLGSYRFSNNWEIGARFRYVTGNPLTPVTGAVFNSDADRYDPIYGRTNAERNPPFHQLDVRGDKRWVFDTWMLNVYLELQNAYNRENPEGRSYSYDFRQSQHQSGLPLLPVLGVRADF